MTIAHKDLTGTDLHEVKGASTATVGQVPIANGSGGAPFGKLTASSLTGTGNPFGGQLIHAVEAQIAGVSSASAAATGTWLTTALNSLLTNEVTGASFGANVITVPAGTYYCDIIVPWGAASTGAVETFQSRLYNLTTVGTQIYGNVCKFYVANGNAVLMSHIRGRFSLGSLTALVVQHYKTSGAIGFAGGVGSSEIYTQASIWRVA